MNVRKQLDEELTTRRMQPDDILALETCSPGCPPRAATNGS